MAKYQSQKEQQDIDKCMACKRFEANIGRGSGNYREYCGIYSRPKDSCEYIALGEKEKENENERDV